MSKGGHAMGLFAPSHTPNGEHVASNTGEQGSACTLACDYDTTLPASRHTMHGMQGSHRIHQTKREDSTRAVPPSTAPWTTQQSHTNSHTQRRPHHCQLAADWPQTPARATTLYVPLASWLGSGGTTSQCQVAAGGAMRLWLEQQPNRPIHTHDGTRTHTH